MELISGWQVNPYVKCNLLIFDIWIDSNGVTPFWMACHVGDVAILDWMVSQGVSFNEMSRDGKNILKLVSNKSCV